VKAKPVKRNYRKEFDSARKLCTTTPVLRRLRALLNSKFALCSSAARPRTPYRAKPARIKRTVTEVDAAYRADDVATQPQYDAHPVQDEGRLEDRLIKGLAPRLLLLLLVSSDCGRAR
jgi:hypothetical protein